MVDLLVEIGKMLDRNIEESDIPPHQKLGPPLSV
jgi:hypothetical protein